MNALTIEKLQKVESLIADGKSTKEAADEVGWSVSAVHSARYGYKKTNGGKITHYAAKQAAKAAREGSPKKDRITSEVSAIKYGRAKALVAKGWTIKEACLKNAWHTSNYYHWLNKESGKAPLGKRALKAAARARAEETSTALTVSANVKPKYHRIEIPETLIPVTEVMESGAFSITGTPSAVAHFINALRKGV